MQSLGQPIGMLLLVQDSNPLDFRVPILSQCGFLGIMLPIFIWLPETPGRCCSMICCVILSTPTGTACWMILQHILPLVA